MPRTPGQALTPELIVVVAALRLSTAVSCVTDVALIVGTHTGFLSLQNQDATEHVTPQLAPTAHPHPPQAGILAACGIGYASGSSDREVFLVMWMWDNWPADQLS